MKTPRIKTKVVHSESKSAWNVIGTQIGGKYKIARVPYVPTENKELHERFKEEARQHAEFISYCFNKAEMEKHFPIT